MKKRTPEELGTAPISSLLLSYALPAIIAMMASSLYNIIDRVFIGQGVGPLAISGLALTFPIMNLSTAFGALIGAGGSTLVSIKMGQEDIWGAKQVLGNVIILNVILGTIFMIVGLAFIDEILFLFGASNDTLPYARDFMQIILLGNVFTHLYFGLNSVMRSSGYPQKAMYATIFTVLINLILAPIFIFVLEWGIRGAALATVIAQLCSLIWILFHFSQKIYFIHFEKGIFKLKKNIIRGIFSIGMSPFVMNTCACLVVIFINHSLKSYGGDLAIGAYGIVNSILMLFAMLVLGFSQGMQPIAGFNYGAQKYDRVMSVFKRTMAYSTIVTFCASFCAIAFPQTITSFFTTDSHLIEIAKQGMQISFSMFAFVSIPMVAGNFFQSIGKAKISIFLSASRQLLFLIPLMLILPQFFGLMGVWLSLPLSDLFAILLALFYIKTLKF
ncbi:MAG: MATE family efflux transporter [Paludibacteraceae bacterium]|jgi:putative MATE family efflux protein|nr:MATE family efflux transporter [Paludibacteraceae bacterium]